jgi:hypothetical protein
MMAFTIVDSMSDPALFEPWFRGPSWNAWRAILKAAFALPMSPEEITLFRSVAERDPPSEPVKELWIVGGRRGGKDSIASLLASHASAMFEGAGLLRPGERAAVMCLASDRDQAKIVLNYTREMFAQVDLLKGMVTRETATGFELHNGVDITIATNNFRAVRGKPLLLGILDEAAFYHSDDSASPDKATYDAIKPGMASIPGSMLIGISSPHQKSGLLWSKYKKHYGKPGNVLVIKAPTTVLNPTIDHSIIAAALEDDPAAARAEWLAEFRDDIASFVTQEAVDACVSPNVLERPRVQGARYSAFCDPSGGVSDSMTLAISHSEYDGKRQRDIAILDALREIRAPFSPEDAVTEFAALLKSYGIKTTRGDRYAAEWVVDAFKKVGIDYQPADLSKSDIYRDFLPRLNSAEVDLLDNQRLVTQLLGLERRTARGGRDSIDHTPGGKDDLINAAAGSLVYVSSARHNVKAGWGTFLGFGYGGSLKTRQIEFVEVEPTPEVIGHQAQLAAEARSRRDEIRADLLRSTGRMV